MKIADIKREFEKYIVLKDEYALEVVLGTLIGNALLTRDPLWLMMVAPSSGGKSTLLAPCVAVPAVYFLDDLTEKTFLSGFKLKGKETSLLKIIGSGVICFSDFTSILSKNPLSRGEILGQLRLIYDGNFSKRTGTGEIKWAGKIGFLGASTPDIYHILDANRSMGERYLYYWLTQPTDEEIVKKQESVSMSSREISEAMQPFYRDYVEGVRTFVNKHGVPPLTLSAEQQARVDYAAIFCVKAKSTVHLDFKTSRPDSLVSTPGVGRDRKMFQTFLQSLQLMYSYEQGDANAGVTGHMIRVVEKCAWSSVGRERRKILEILTKYDTAMTASEIGATDDFGLQKEGIEKYLFVLHAVGLIQKQTQGNSFKWLIADEKEKVFIRNMSGIGNEKPVLDRAALANMTPEEFEANQKLLDNF